MYTIDQTLEYLIQSISPTADFSITSTQEEGITNFQISAPSETIGQLIGKEGKIIKSIRSLLTLSYPTFRYNIQFTEKTG